MQPAGATATSSCPPHPDARRRTPPVPMDAPQPTGPVDFVPGLPGRRHPARAAAGAAAPPPTRRRSRSAPRPPAPSWPDTLESDDATRAPGEGAPLRRRGTAPPAARAPRDRAALLGLGLAVLSLVLLELGPVPRLRRRVLLVGRTAVVGVRDLLRACWRCWPSPRRSRRGSRVRSGAAWRIAAGGLVGLAVFWLLVVLPVVASDRGFLLTAALGALGAALWIGPGRKD